MTPAPPVRAVAARVDAALYRASGWPARRRTCLLTSRGRKTGRLRTLPLGYVEADGGVIAVAASGRGAPRHPMWYRNLLDDPRATVQIGREVRRVRARTAGGGERAGLWEQLTAGHPRLADEQAGTRREIPVVLLVPSDWVA
ncbi:nitroreductase/quinone reductase family protein [Nocardiopsis coralliicola]